MLMEDNPELQPLGSSLFADQIEKVAWLVVATAKMEGDAKYSMATPDEAWRTMVAAWDLVPADRIVADILRFRTALDAIIAAKGAYVSDCDLRNGHRRAMQRLVRGGALRDDNGNRAETAARVEAGLKCVMESWKGMTAEVGAEVGAAVGAEVGGSDGK